MVCVQEWREMSKTPTPAQPERESEREMEFKFQYEMSETERTEIRESEIRDGLRHPDGRLTPKGLDLYTQKANGVDVGRPTQPWLV